MTVQGKILEFKKKKSNWNKLQLRHAVLWVCLLDINYITHDAFLKHIRLQKLQLDLFFLKEILMLAKQEIKNLSLILLISMLTVSILLC